MRRTTLLLALTCALLAPPTLALLAPPRPSRRALRPGVRHAAPVEPEIPVAASEVQTELSDEQPVAASEVRTELTEEQRAALQAFAEIDVDGDGELTADEIFRALSKNDADVTLEHVKELVAKADTDGNGTVNQREYLDAVAADVMPTIIVDAVPDGVIDIEPEEPRDEAGAGRGGARWRVVAAWARWERGGLLSHLAADDLNTLRDALAAAAPAAELVQTSAADALEARLEIVEVVLCVGGDATTCVAAFASAAGGTDEIGVSSLRRTLAAPVAAESDVRQQNNAVDAWLAIDACAEEGIDPQELVPKILLDFKPPDLAQQALLAPHNLQARFDRFEHRRLLKLKDIVATRRQLINETVAGKPPPTIEEMASDSVLLEERKKKAAQ